MIANCSLIPNGCSASAGTVFGQNEYNNTPNVQNGDQTIQEAGQRILTAIERGETPQAEWVLQAAQAAGADSTTIDAIRDGEISAQNSEAPAQQTDVTQQIDTIAESQNAADSSLANAGADFGHNEYNNTPNTQNGAQTRTERESGNVPRTSAADAAVQTVLDAANAPQNAQRSIDISDDTQFRMVDYEDAATQKQITEQTHEQMVAQGKIVEIGNNAEVAEHYPDLRAVKNRIAMRS